LSAGLSVVIGAAAEHATDASLAASLSQFRIAHQYHQFHAFGLLIVGLILSQTGPSRCLVWSGWLMVVGTLLFSGNLYLRSMAGIHQFHTVTPFGGAAFILAWILLAIGVVTRTTDAGRSAGASEG
jgi:uncharacterized membrane protein YgdD (TMEM256/DUF423 family)